MRVRLSKPFTLQQIASVVQGPLFIGSEPKQLIAPDTLTTDSREVMPGDLFAAPTGVQTDDLRFAKEALERGAAVVIARPSDGIRELFPRIECEPLTALSRLAAAISHTVPHKTVAVTGSVGKTTTRRMIATLLSKRFLTWENPENYNNLLGNSLSLITMPGDTEWLISECGMNAPGEIAPLSLLLHPDIAVITNIGVSHIGNMGSRSAICQEKLSITRGMNGGTLCYTADDSLLRRNVPQSAVAVSAEHTDVPFHPAGVRLHTSGTHFDFVTPNGIVHDLFLSVPGRQMLSCACLALTVANLTGVDDDAMRQGLAEFRQTKKRQYIHSIGNTVIIDDTYNASPDSMAAALETLRMYAGVQRGAVIAVLGDMLELGAFSASCHRAVGETFARGGITHLFAIGNRAKDYASGACHGGMAPKRIRAYSADTLPECIAGAVFPLLNGGGTVLVKGSRGMKMERIIPPLLHMIEGAE